MYLSLTALLYQYLIKGLDDCLKNNKIKTVVKNR